MKRISVVLLAPVLVGVVACSDSPTAVSPPAVQLELVDPGQRLDENQINSHVHGTFALEFGNGGGVITDGPGIVPGNNKEHGWCYDGEWENPKGKRTSGSLTKPHPFCYQSSTSIQVVLEPISARNRRVGENNENLQLAANRPDGDVQAHVQGNDCGPPNNPPCTEGRGTIEAYAVNADTWQRVGILTIDLTQYTSGTNYFLEDCSFDISATHVRCLNLVIDADYEPLPAAEGGVGSSQTDVPGMLYWVNATEPFNYD